MMFHPNLFFLIKNKFSNFMSKLSKITIAFSIILSISTNKFFGQAFRFNTVSYSGDFITIPNVSSATFASSNLFLGLGYEQNIGEKIALSLELSHSYGFITGPENSGSKEFSYFDTGNNLSNFTYSRVSYISYLALNYQSKYFFYTNQDVSTYISTGIGLKSVKWYLKPEIDNNSIPESFQGKFSNSPINENKLVVPITFRLGRRGSLDDTFGDISIGVSYNLGANGLNENKYLKYLFEESPMRNIAFGINYSFGFGWAD